MVLGSKIWVLGVLIATEMTPFLGTLSGQSEEMGICLLAHIYTHTPIYFCICVSIYLYLSIK